MPVRACKNKRFLSNQRDRTISCHERSSFLEHNETFSFRVTCDGRGRGADKESKKDAKGDFISNCRRIRRVCADQRKLDSIFPRWFGEHSHSVAFLSRLQVSWHVFCAASGTWTSLRPSRTSLTSVLDRGKVPSRVEGARKTKCFSKKLVNVWPILKRPALQNVPVFHFSVAPCKTEYFLLNKHYHRTIPPEETVSRLPREKQRVGRWPVEKVTKLKSWGTKFSWNDRLSRCSNNTFIQP